MGCEGVVAADIDDGADSDSGAAVGREEGRWLTCEELAPFPTFSASIHSFIHRLNYSITQKVIINTKHKI